MDEIKAILLNVQDTVINLQKSFIRLEQNQQEMKQDIQGIKQEQQEMKQDIQGIKQEQQGIKQEIAEIKQKLNGIDEAQNIIVKEILKMQGKHLVKKDDSSINTKSNGIIMHKFNNCVKTEGK